MTPLIRNVFFNEMCPFAILNLFLGQIKGVNKKKNIALLKSDQLHFYFGFNIDIVEPYIVGHQQTEEY